MSAAWLAALLIGQSLSTQAIDSAEVERVQRALARAATVQTVHISNPAPPPWAGATTLPPYAMTGYPLYHYEFLAQTTPEAFRASTLYPGARGPEITPLLKALFTASSPELRRWREAHARKEVHQALQDHFTLRTRSPS
jgi:hypothetical protein